MNRKLYPTIKIGKLNIAIINEWAKEEQFFHLISVGFHECEDCNQFSLSLFGISLKIFKRKTI